MNGTSRPIKTSLTRNALTRRLALQTTRPSTPQWSHSMVSSSSNIFTMGVPPGPSPPSSCPTFTIKASQCLLSTMTLKAQMAHAEKFDKEFHPRSHWGRYRHNYENLVPTLKTFGASTFFANFCRPLTWEQLEAREGTLGTSYSPDLLDLFFAFLSFHGTLPVPFFRATPDALEKVLLQGCYRPPGDLAGLFHITQEPHETPINFYTRAFLLPLRFPCLATLGLTPPDIFAIESAFSYSKQSLQKFHARSPTQLPYIITNSIDTKLDILYISKILISSWYY